MKDKLAQRKIKIFLESGWERITSKLSKLIKLEAVTAEAPDKDVGNSSVLFGKRENQQPTARRGSPSKKAQSKYDELTMERKRNERANAPKETSANGRRGAPIRAGLHVRKSGRIKIGPLSIVFA